MRYVGLFAIIIFRAVTAIPGAIVRSTLGWGYASRFEIGGKTVVRPERFGSKAHKRAFEDLGRYLTSALTRDVLLSYQEKALVQDDLFGRHKVPLEVWREVLAFFHDEGCVLRRWELGVPSYGEYLRTPSWGPDGGRLIQAKVSAIGGVVPDSSPFIPSLLTDAQKDELFGEPYALHPVDGLGEKTLTYVTLQERNFAVTYVRPRAQLSDKALDQGAKTLGKVLKYASKD